jgi:hypothetical protein
VIFPFINATQQLNGWNPVILITLYYYLVFVILHIDSKLSFFILNLTFPQVIVQEQCRIFCEKCYPRKNRLKQTLWKRDIFHLKAPNLLVSCRSHFKVHNYVLLSSIRVCRFWFLPFRKSNICRGLIPLIECIMRWIYGTSAVRNGTVIVEIVIIDKTVNSNVRNRSVHS